MQRQGALADPSLAGAHGHEMAHPDEPVGDAGALLGHLLEDSGPSVADDVVIGFHLLPRGCAPRTPLHAHSRGPRAPLRSRGSLASLVRASVIAYTVPNRPRSVTIASMRG